MSRLYKTFLEKVALAIECPACHSGPAYWCAARIDEPHPYAWIPNLHGQRYTAAAAAGHDLIAPGSVVRLTAWVGDHGPGEIALVADTMLAILVGADFALIFDDDLPGSMLMTAMRHEIEPTDVAA